MTSANLSSSPPSLLTLLQRYFPDPGSPMGRAKPPAPPIDMAALHADLTAIAHRLRQRMNLIMGVVLGWLVIQLIVALATTQPYASVVALGMAGGGTLWCVTTLIRTAKELFYAESMAAAAGRDPEFLRDLVDLARERLRPTVKPMPKRRKPTQSAAPAAP